MKRTSIPFSRMRGVASRVGTARHDDLTRAARRVNELRFRSFN
jgi:hypothetical protein